MEEIWRDVHLNSKYKVSNFGRIKGPRRMLVPCLRNGYNSITISLNSIRRTTNIHTLVAEAFLDKPKTRCCVNHKDGNKLNNCVSNLEWVSYKENTKHAIETNLAIHWTRKINQLSLPEKSIVATFNSISEAEEKTGISNKHISSVCRGKRNSTGGFAWQYVDNVNPCIETPDGIEVPEYPNYIINQNGIFSKRYSAYLVPKRNSNGFFQIKLTNEHGHKDFYLHVLQKLLNTGS